MRNFLVDFGTSQSGLATVGYTQMQADGSVIVARTTAGVVAFGNGVYGVTVTLNALTTAIQWDTGTATPLYAVDTVEAPTALDIAAAVLAAAQVTPIESNVKQVNDRTIIGTGVPPTFPTMPTPSDPGDPFRVA